MPRVSVLLATYNTPPAYLAQAIDSVLAQSFSDFELLIVDDASTDEAVEKTILSYGDKRIRYARNAENLGIAGTRNRLIDMAQGEYLAVMDHDDMILPERLEKQVTFLDAHPEIGLCGTAYRRFGRFFKNGVIRHPTHHNTIKAALFFKCVIHHPSVMMRSALLKEQKIRYDESLISANDRKLYMDMAAHTKLHNLSDVLCLYRMHQGMTSQTKRQDIAEERVRLAKVFLTRLGATLTDQQEFAFYQFVVNRRTRINNRRDLEDVKSALSITVEANKRSHFLPQEEFEKVCHSLFEKVRRDNFVRSTSLSVSEIIRQRLIQKIRKSTERMRASFF